MSNYKLVQLEPTPEMIEAAEEAYMPFGDMDLAIRMALLTAPDVQGEPVAHLRRDQLQQIKTRGPVVGEISPSPRGDMVAVYAAPQPAEQQPELAKYQPCGCVICTCEHETQCQGCGARHCGTHPVGQFSEPAYLQPAEQKPISHDWDGEGVPPIGTVCEYHWTDDDWRRCEIVGHYFGSVVAVDVFDNSALRLPVDILRPIKTPEQIAAEEQKPAPDVSALVEALEWLRGAVNCTPEIDWSQAGTWISARHPRIKQIDEILATHRKKGDQP